MPYEGISVLVESESGDAALELATDAKGVARLDSLPAGEYAVSFLSGRMNGGSEVVDYQINDVSVTDGEVMPLSFMYTADFVDKEVGSIVVRTADENDVPTAGVEITIQDNTDILQISAKTNAEGIARFGNLSPNFYTYLASSGRMEGDELIHDYHEENIPVSGGEIVPITLQYPVDASDSEYGTIIIRTVDEFDVPLRGIWIQMEPHGKPIFKKTNAEGIARFDSLPPENCNVNACPGNTMAEIIHTLSIKAVAGRTIEKKLYFPMGPVDIPVHANISTNNDNPFENIDVYFPDWDYSPTFDKHGAGVLYNIVLDDTFYDVPVAIIKNDSTFTHLATVETDYTGWPYFEFSISSPPSIEIVMPQTDDVFNDRCVRLIGDGEDFEDDYLPDDAFSWSSDIDGELGTGRDITPSLSIGRHTITLTGEDSVGGTSSTDVVINVSHFSSQMYFPFPQGGVWKYSYETPEMIVTNNTGDTERWILSDMTVSVDDVTERTCRMDWTVERDSRQMVCRYVLTDYLTTDENRFVVTATDEVMTVYDGDEPAEELSVETVYTPSYPLLADYLDPNAGSGEEWEMTAENNITHTRFATGSRSWADTETVTISYETGSAENIATQAGTYTAIPFRSTYNGVERTWWLARGIGIVRMEYDLFGETVTASLQDTNMADFTGGAGKRSASFYGKASIRIQCDASAGEQKQMREIMRIMRDLCPR